MAIPRITFVRRRRGLRLRWRTIRTVASYAWALRPGPLLLALVAAAALIAPYGQPHLLVWYEYERRGGAKFYTRCEYWGLKPFTVTWVTQCPIFVMKQKSKE